VAADRLVDAARAQVPATVTRHELAGDVAHERLADLAGARGWTATEPNHVLVADATVVDAWPADDDGDVDVDDDTGVVLRGATTDDTAAIAVLHDAQFPDTYASAAQLVEGQLDGSRLVLVADTVQVAGVAGAIAGYAAGEIHEDGEGFIDFVVVDSTARRAGVGRRLVMAVTRQLLAQSSLGRVGLAVQDHRAPARALYQRLGFRSDGSMVAYRSWT
jgi:ribosomal protein S18 acetylase RimI-like enzyme